ncbi:MAG: hypothetical protein FWE01_01785 [Firmicutes bacterium]|nr:hypothetical protein [Bacillota bacterium]
MRIKNIISNVAEVLGLSDVVEFVQGGATIAQLRENMNYASLLRCASLVVSNISANHSETIARQSFDMTGTDGVILFDSFKENVQSIKQVTQRGRVVEYGLYHDRLVVPKVLVEITFAFTPSIVTGNEHNPFKLPHQVLEYGILAEYAFISGMFNEGRIWNEKFLEMIFGAKHRTGKAACMPTSF